MWLRVMTASKVATAFNQYYEGKSISEYYTGIRDD